MFFVVFLPTKRGLSLICYSSDCLLSTTNQRFFLSESSTLRLISGYSPKKALAILLAIKKKAEIFYKEFLGILQSFWRILDISNYFRAFFGEIPERSFGHISRIMQLSLAEPSGKAQVQEVGGHAAEDQKRIQTSSWLLNHPGSVHTKFYRS